MRILQYGYPRSGTTITWYLLDLLFSPLPAFDEDRHLNPANVKKTHNQELITSKEYDFCVITIREPLGTVKSRMRVEHSHNYNSYLNHYLRRYSTLFNILNNLPEDRYILLDYHEHILNIERLLNIYEQVFKIDIDDKRELINRYSRDSIRKTIDPNKNFNYYDKHTQIHGEHVAPDKNPFDKMDSDITESMIYKRCVEMYKKISSLYLYNDR